MAESDTEKLFKTEVLPIMDSVMKDLRHKQLEEIGRHCSSFSYIAAGAMGPDGGAAAQMASLDSLRYTGKWNSKHTEDYILMVKEELQKNNVRVTPEIEKMMIDKMIKDEIPKSSIDYIMKKAATSTLFYLPQALNKSPLENHIAVQAEKEYNPTPLEKGTGWALGATADFLSMGGMGGGFGSAVKFVGVDLAMNAVLDKVDKKYGEEVPLVIAPEYKEEYLAEQKKEAEQSSHKEEQPKEPAQEEAKPQAAPSVERQQEFQSVQEEPKSSNTNGWGGLLTTFGLNGLGDIGHNLGYVLAMLPDVLVGLFTGKTKSLGIKDNIMPLASILAGMFVKNPILKMVLISMGGLNLLNKAGHEAIDMQQSNSPKQDHTMQHNYKVYQDEVLNSRISQPQIRGNCLLATIDKVPCTIALPDNVVDAYQHGALPLNTLANAVLAKNDQMRQMASDNYAANQQQTQTRTLAQR